jgi:hypothetical protein
MSSGQGGRRATKAIVIEVSTGMLCNAMKRHLTLLCILSPVFRDMLVIGDVPSDISDGSSSRPSKRRRIEPTQGISIPLDDDFGPLEFLFKLLDGSVGRLHDHAAYSIMGIKLLADEYELALATRLLGEQLWQEVVEGTYGTTRAYAIAMRMQWKALARFALSRMDSDRRPPVKWSLETAQIVGLDAWHCAINAASDCKPFDWEEVAERLEFPPS